MEDLNLPLIIFIVAAVVFAGINIVRGVLGRRRRNRRVEDGARSEAEVVATGELAPPERTQVPFTLRFQTPAGQVVEREFTRGFQGIVPVVGWRVRVLFDPEDPDNVEITDNPYLHPVPGAPDPVKPRPVLRYAAPPVFIAAAALFGFLLLSALSGGRSLVPVAVGGLFTLVGLVFLFAGIGIWRAQRRLREEPARTTGTVTHSWKEVRRRRDADGGRTTRVSYPYAVHYVLPDGRHVHKRSSTSTNRQRTVGEHTEVLYDPSEPTHFFADGASSMKVMPLVFIGFGVVFPILGSTIAVIARMAS
ncbi:DUF3592 domain-containing protein [Nocardiopsis suaedae]|uniref:DUF3592 domain-containing protein n=1 Tax=Nocardiopsis suaedae TaxID=3018444 RepID=A0ABT4TFP1_9ACTN|nr:DUF3592 domain-containing protein [Nocardiopsis suaedae]MDA2803530.1 DUF3592 domain-containing protein [Nocardiopsis suaedae]